MAVPRNTRETEAFPDFLVSDPYPSQPDSRPISGISGISEVTSTYETAASERSGVPPSWTGPVGEPGNPPSRPSTATPSGNEPLRAAIPASGARRAQGPFGPRRDDQLLPVNSRPGSALSRTHIPSVTAQGFFRPMSPATLQAQRGPTPLASSYEQPSRVASPAPTRDSIDEIGQRQRQYSNASVNTLRDRPPTSRNEVIPPLPTSRAGFSDAGGDRNRPGPGSVMSKNSTTPLHTANFTPRSQEERRLSSFRTSSIAPNLPKTSLSFRASFGLTSARGMGLDRRISSQGHEKLPSQPNSPSDDIDHKILPPIPAPKVSNHRNHEYYAGNTVFLFLGRLMNTRAEPLNLLTVFLVVLPAVLFFVSSAPWLWYNVSPALPIVYGYIVFLTLSSFSHAAFSDPGMLPRNLHPHPPNPEEERDALAPGPPTTEWIMVRTFPRAPSKKVSASDAALAEGAMATAMEVPTKYCKSCQIWRPPRCHHCRICDTCVEGQDHHCVWLNQCVGRRNYRFFFSFVGTCTIMSLLTIAFSLTHIGTYANATNIPFGQALSGNWPERLAFAVFIYAVLALPYPGALFCYHLFLMTRGETTREYLNSHKFPPKDRHRPFALPSPLANLALVLSRPRGPSYMEFKRHHVEGDMRFGHEKPVKERKREAATEAVAREGRVKDLMNRFSVGGVQSQKSAANVEMEPLPPVPPTPLPNARDSRGRFNAAESMGLSGVGVNRTPR